MNGASSGGGEVDPYIGRVVAGRFQVEALVGTGGMGRVYKARHLGLDRTVCLKMLRPQLLEDPSIVGRFEREAKAASRLNHPHSIQILDFGQDENGSLFIVMEFVSGRDLRKLLHDEFPVGEERVCDIAAQVLSALAEAHESQVVHRDLKPENIMVEVRRDAPDFVKVLDFGIAKIQDPDLPGLTRADVVCGTPLYMSPEQATGAEFDGRADLYAVGVILYQLVTNTLPFDGANSMEILTKHVRDLPVPPRIRRPEVAISPELEALILRALAKDPAKRPQTAIEFRQELLKIGEKARRRREEAEEAAQSASTEFRLKQEAELAAHHEAQRAAQQTVVRSPVSDEADPRSSKTPLLIAAAAAVLLLGGGALWAILAPSPAPEPIADLAGGVAAVETVPGSDEPEVPIRPLDIDSGPDPDSPDVEEAVDGGEKETSASAAVETPPSPTPTPSPPPSRTPTPQRRGDRGSQGGAAPSPAVATRTPEPTPAAAVAVPPPSRPAEPAANAVVDRRRAGALADDGDLFFEEENYREAIRAYRQAIAADPELARAYRGLFRAGFASGDRSAASTGANGYLKLTPHAPDGTIIQRQLESM